MNLSRAAALFSALLAFLSTVAVYFDVQPFICRRDEQVRFLLFPSVVFFCFLYPAFVLRVAYSSSVYM